MKLSTILLAASMLAGAIVIAAPTASADCVPGLNPDICEPHWLPCDPRGGASECLPRCYTYGEYIVCEWD